MEFSCSMYLDDSSHKSHSCQTVQIVQTEGISLIHAVIPVHTYLLYMNVGSDN